MRVSGTAPCVEIPAVSVAVVVNQVPAGEVVGAFKSHGVGEGVDGASLHCDGQSVAQGGAAQCGGHNDVVCARCVPSGGDAVASGGGGCGTNECPSVCCRGGASHSIGGRDACSNHGGAADGDAWCVAVGEDGPYHPCAVKGSAAGCVERHPCATVECHQAAVAVGSDVA